MNRSTACTFDYRVRQQTPDDRPAIYRLIRTAFETAKVKDGDEQDFADRLQDSEAFIPALGLVAEADGQLVGHILFTHTEINRPDGNRVPVLLVAPLSVLLPYRNRGVGSALMREGLRVADSLGYGAAFLCGDPGYYHRFGYVEMGEYGVASSSGIPGQYCLAYEISPGALQDVRGVLAGF